MRVINISEAKAQLSRLVAAVQAGERIVIARAGRPAAVLIPYDADTAPRTLGGSWEGRLWMADDFDELPEELRRAFAGEGP